MAVYPAYPPAISKHPSRSWHAIKVPKDGSVDVLYRAGPLFGGDPLNMLAPLGLSRNTNILIQYWSWLVSGHAAHAIPG